jgi:hypothetical protein
MVNIRVPIAFLACMALGALGCTKSTPPAGRTSSARSESCDGRMLELDQLGGILLAPLKARRAVDGDAQTCIFLTEGFPAITVSVRPNVGHATVDAWMAGRMPFTATPLDGIGDQAVWQDTLHEVIAQKNNLLCDIEVRGGDGDIAAAVDVLPRLLGALCNKALAAFG